MSLLRIKNPFQSMKAYLRKGGKVLRILEL